MTLLVYHCFNCLVIFDFYSLPQLLRAVFQLLHQVHPDAQVKGKVGVLMRRVQGFSHKEVQVCALFDEARIIYLRMEIGRNCTRKCQSHGRETRNKIRGT